MARTERSFQIVRAAVEQLDLLAPLFDTYREFYRLPSDHSRARAYLGERLSREESVVFLALAGSGSGTTALGFTQLYPSFSSLSMKRVWILYDLYVIPQARRRGVGKALMGAAQPLAADTSADSIVLETAVDDHNAQRLYEQLGYQRDAAFYRYALSIQPA